ncbi:MAG: single-stranded DNA-binding protein [Parcubacteria group bacterium]|nr:single-stranded DNA-binding protein [Parcubacteria group bacterium]
MNLNRVELIGHITADPSVKTLNGGQEMTRFTLATNRVWKDSKTKEKKEQSEFHPIVAWDKLGEICKQYLKKGKQVYVEGRLQSRNWEDMEKKKHSLTEIIADNVIFLGGKGSQTSAETVSATANPDIIMAGNSPASR